MNLFINTAKSNIDIMLFDDKKIIQKISKISKNNHTMVLYECIELLNISFEKLEGIYVVNGPGSYTGLRVGVIYAKTLALALNIPIFPIKQTKLLDAYLQDDYAIDLRGKKYYYKHDIVSASEVSDNIILDPQLDLEKIYYSNVLKKCKQTPIKEVEIFYAKDAI